MVRGLGEGNCFLEGIGGFGGRVCCHQGLGSGVVFWSGTVQSMVIYCIQFIQYLLLINTVSY